MTPKGKKITGIDLHHLAMIFKGSGLKPVNADAQFLFVKGKEDGTAQTITLTPQEAAFVADLVEKATQDTATPTIGSVIKSTRVEPSKPSSAHERAARDSRAAPIVAMYQMSAVPMKDLVEAEGGGIIGCLRAARKLNNGGK
jgi:hypothetical protein